MTNTNPRTVGKVPAAKKVDVLEPYTCAHCKRPHDRGYAFRVLTAARELLFCSTTCKMWYFT